ncbi:SDR family NAD(P)-dependent oxidoreductase [Bradyrhizobium sp. AUGA SZCCT0240]|uniref:SDR family NAD(P)-dependent oxidoreductase n=1 Tax=unclassified Bradyrhizobium TaxID=2631580 RepID=UPI0020125744
MGSIKKAFDLTGKNALVTGGSRGLGLQIAEALGEQGARVVISSRKAPDLEKAQAHLAGLGIKAEWIAADNSRDEDVKRLADETIKKLGRVDILAMPPIMTSCRSATGSQSFPTPRAAELAQHEAKAYWS